MFLQVIIFPRATNGHGRPHGTLQAFYLITITSARSMFALFTPFNQITLCAYQVKSVLLGSARLTMVKYFFYYQTAPV